MNHREHSARKLKAERLARAIVATNMGLTADDVLAFAVGSIVWTNVALLATELELAAGTIGDKERVHPPHSRATVEAVAAELRRVQDSNRSAFTGHRETGNLDASGSLPVRVAGSVEHRAGGHGGETSANSDDVADLISPPSSGRRERTEWA